MEFDQLLEKLMVKGLAPGLIGEEGVVPVPRESLHQDAERVVRESVDLGYAHPGLVQGPEDLEFPTKR